MSETVIKVYKAACAKENVDVVEDFVTTLRTGAKVALLSQRKSPLSDVDICCIAAAIRAMEKDSPLKVLNLEDNGFGVLGIQALMEALESNPGQIRELRLGRNNLKDEGAVIIGDVLSRSGCGLKVLDLSENGITKNGVIPIAAALEHPTSDIVELSFHNNKIEGDAAPFLGKAIRAAAKLKHLHLGYNALRDSGAEQLSQSISHAKLLSTLDLTANRISHAGGVAIAEALLEESCTIQRLNLRHNKMDSEAICRFGEVLRTNTSLIQLFLGYMNPTPEAVTVVLDALRENGSLLLLDIFGWKIPPPRAAELIQAIQEDNTIVAAVVTDACDTVAKSIDLQNADREDRGLHPIYVGPDDRDAYLATKSLRRYSRAQSRRQSRAASARQSVNPSRNASAVQPGRDTERTEGSHRRHRSRGASEVGEDVKSEGSRHRRHRSRGASEAGEETKSEGSRHRRRHRSRGGSEAAEDGANNEASRHRRHRSRGTSEVGDDVKSEGSRHRRHRSHSRGGAPEEEARRPSGGEKSEGRHRRHRSRGTSEAGEDIEKSYRRDAEGSLVRQPQPGPIAAEGALIVKPLQICDAPARAQQAEAKELLEEIKKTPLDPHTQKVVHDLNENLQKQIKALQEAHEKDKRDLLARIEALERRKECHCGGNGAGHSGSGNGTNNAVSGAAAASQPSPFVRSGSNPANSSIPYFSSSAHDLPSNDRPNAIRGGNGAYNSSLPGSAVPYRSMSRMSEGYPERSMTPLVKPNTDAEDMPPSVAQGNDEQGEKRPDEPSLQRSASVVNFPPRIEPSPARDANPPRRKSISVNY
ncbi:Leucine Rich repeat, putative [Angomonas deanei]|uniref:Leucine Rich repeat, putative n=1 Tax=Angomonas deanei TaxID=59799 RepID=A0A7G2CGE3_9TRYP|nr:Leucine Rich repeat, putative [Angomonas deanei]